jgi:hypothetical protein
MLMGAHNAASLDFFRSAAGTVDIYAGTVALTGATTPLVLHAYEFIYNGMTSQMLVDNVSIAAGQTGTTAPTGMTLFARESTGSFAANGYIYAAAVCQGILPASEISRFYAWARATKGVL